MYLASNATNRFDKANFDNIIVGTNSISANVFVLENYTYTSTLASLYYNGFDDGTYSSPPAFSGSGTTNIGAFISGASSLNGYISEVVIYTKALTLPERQIVEGYLANKWAMNTSLPSQRHPFYFKRPFNSQPLSGQMVLLKAVDYPGSGAWFDDSALGNDAILQTGVIAKNQAGNGIVLNGSTNWRFPDVGVAGNWTMSFWYKNTGPNVNGPASIIIQQLDNTIYGGWVGGVGNPNSYPLASRKITAFYGPWYYGTTIQLYDNRWTNIQVTWDGTNMKTYTNTTLLASVQPGGSTYDNLGEFRIGGGWQYTNAWFITGEIGEVRMYSTALTAKQVVADFEESVANYMWQPTEIGGCQLWFDAQDTTSMDLSGSTLTQWNLVLFLIPQELLELLRL
jgi:hypothetical protein